MAASPSTSSWIAPFALGVAAALSLTWISSQVPKSKSRKSSQASKSPSLPPPAASQPSSSTAGNSKEMVFDTPELDNRMLRKAEAVIQWRTTRLILVIERCTNDHNYSAILRSAEALGIQHVFMIDPPLVENDEEPIQETQVKRSEDDIKARAMHHLFAQNALEWLTVRDFQSTEACVAELKKMGFALWVTDLSQEAECLSMGSPQIPEKLALVMGTEAVGCSQYMLEHADLRVYLPLRGFADSLNLSVATALILHQLFTMDPTLVGAISEDDKKGLRTAWFTKLCQQRLLTASQKKSRNKLMANVRQCQNIYERTQSHPDATLQSSEQKKLGNWDTYNTQLQELEALIDPARVQAAVQEWIDTPPEPLTDMRRADLHRVTFVGKGTKKKHDTHWKDMVATTNFQSIAGATANMFREKVNKTKESQ
jgi:tRNA G18 (ribose-2'-O)-methylase SpoU